MFNLWGFLSGQARGCIMCGTGRKTAVLPLGQTVFSEVLLPLPTAKSELIKGD